MEELEQLRKDDSSLSADLLEALKQDSETLKGILAAPREAGRQNLINDNGVGSQILHPSLIAQVDRDFSKLARKVSETIRNGLRSVTFRDSASCAADTAGMQAFLPPCVRPPPARAMV